jgi:hypothetical protein
VRHATDDDLDHLEPLLIELRKLGSLQERKRGSFARGAKAFLHFHEDSGSYYVDVRLDDAFQRMSVTTDSDQANFLAKVRKALQS